jgi:hypothetical protein
MKKTAMIIFLGCVLTLSMVNSSFGGKRAGNRQETRPQPGTCETIAALSLEELSPLEIEYLILMREEEKLARDVYETLAGLWNLAIFDNIARSEQRHMDAVGALIDKYSDILDDPVQDDTTGVFSDPLNVGFSGLYNEWTQTGGGSTVAALRVGAEIEDLDIGDLIEALGSVDNNDIQVVFKNLLQGSANHYAAFTRLLEASGETYTPEHFSMEDLEALIGSTNGKGRRGRQSSSMARTGRRGMGCYPECSSGELQELTGTVFSMQLEAGGRYPSFTLENGATTIIAGPYRSWIKSEFSLVEGESVSVMAFPSQLLPETWIAVSITKLDEYGNTLGPILILRQNQDRSGAGNRGSVRGNGSGRRLGGGLCQIEN